MEKYDPKAIEKKWQEKWEKEKIFEAKDYSKNPKFFILDMFPYPSGAGLHVGHPRGYVGSDIIAHFKRMNGYNVLHPMGWDAFGLPAENYAIKTGIHPAVSIKENIQRFKKQMGNIGLSYDWSREINTTDPDYYKWTQWIFLKLFEKGLAYQATLPINWCPSCKTGLANEEVVNGKCERCGTVVTKKNIKQWVLKITDYAEKLLDGLEKLDWPEKIKEMQRNWIGKSEGADIIFPINNSDLEIKVFTTRPDTIFGATFMVLAPEHKLVEKITISEKLEEVKQYQEETKKKLDIERQIEDKEKTGVFTGAYAVNPATKEKIPIYIADYVLPHYGYGAIMAVPAHDERDLEFAKRYRLEIIEVVAPYYLSDCFRDDKITEDRDVVTAIVKNSKTNQYLCLEWKSTGWKSFPAGGIDGEDIVVAAKREVEEETGYKNIRFIKQIGNSIYADFYRPHKNSNIRANFRCLLFELENEERSAVDEKEKQQHGVVWIDEDKVESFLNVWNMKVLWQRFLNDSYVYNGNGKNINSDFLNNLKTEEAQKKIIKWLENKKFGKQTINYKLRDWVFSRQRYWGEPIPLVFCENCKKRIEKGDYKKGEFSKGELLNPGWIALPDKELPLELPKLEKYQPTGTGESPLEQVKDWIQTKCPKCESVAIRETNTMPQWAGSCWYFIRYIDPKNKKELIDKRLAKHWLPVDFYIGGAEHAVLHLLYSRFWIKVLYDAKIIHFSEPFLKLQTIGLILASDRQKMSKSRGNVINPDEVIENYGADAFRLYEMFMGPFDQPISWDSEGILGTRRFLEKIWNIFSEINGKDSKKIERKLHQVIKKVTEDIQVQKFNTAIAAMMEFVNEVQNHGISKKQAESFLKILTPFAPHIAEELWHRLGYENSILKEKWPEYDKKLIEEEAFYLVVQINGKLRDTIGTPLGISEKQAKKLALESEKIQKWLKDKKIKKIIFVKDKLINFVVK